MSKPSFEEIWNRIIAYEGKTFYTKKRLEFIYRIKDDIFYPSRTTYRISKTEFEKAYRLLPLNGPGEINRTVRGPTYVWAVLYDQRISLGKW